MDPAGLARSGIMAAMRADGIHRRNAWWVFFLRQMCNMGLIVRMYGGPHTCYMLLPANLQ